MQGVMLSHGNLNYQRRNLQYYVQPQAGDRALALLPPWHIYERACAYFLFSTGCQIVYTNIRRALAAADLTCFGGSQVIMHDQQLCAECRLSTCVGGAGNSGKTWAATHPITLCACPWCWTPCTSACRWALPST